MLEKKCAPFWAKASNNGDQKWLPLKVHMFDSCYVAQRLWDIWIPKHTKKIISDEIVSNEVSAKQLFEFICASHDVGKAIPAFQRKEIKGNELLHKSLVDSIEKYGLNCKVPIDDYTSIKHAIASECILERNGIDITITSIVGSHHGMTPTESSISDIKISSYPANTGFSNSDWCDAQDAMLNYAFEISGIKIDELRKIRISIGAQVLLSGALIMVDWISSNQEWFPLIENDDINYEQLIERCEKGWQNAAIPKTWAPSNINMDNIFTERFDIEPRPFQTTIAEIASSINKPGIMIIEAPMGEGKTEAALVASEILSKRFGLGGVFFALPTQATSDGIFPRMKKWMDCLSSTNNDYNTFFLAHGKSKFNKEYTEMQHINWKYNVPDGEKTVIHEWFVGKNKGLLSDFVAGTVDNILMAGLKIKHLQLRHLGIANKVVIIDECHAYDAYMGSYLVKVMQWLGEYNVPVLIMSATLYPSRREELVKAYSGKNRIISEPDGWIDNCGYPIVTYLDDDKIKQTLCAPSGRNIKVKIVKIKDDDLLKSVNDVSTDGGYIGIIVNTVKRSQKIYRQIKTKYPDDRIVLIHSKFTCLDRSEKESEIVNILGKQKRDCTLDKVIIIGTQVIEQSLDIDFDVLFTDLCPIDLLLQRIGRLHRHENMRPPRCIEARCYVMGEEKFNSECEYIYGKYLLYRTRYILPDIVNIPSDVVTLVHKVYSDEEIKIPDEMKRDYNKSRDEDKRKVIDKESRAKTFQIRSPWSRNNMIDWLKDSAEDDASETMAMATVRDSENIISVIAIRCNGDNTLSPISERISLSDQDEITPRLAFLLSGSKISLPVQFSINERTLRSCLYEILMTANEKIPKSWINSDWLKGEYYLLFDKNNETILNGVKLRYSFEEGLITVGRD